MCTHTPLKSIIAGKKNKNKKREREGEKLFRYAALQRADPGVTLIFSNSLHFLAINLEGQWFAGEKKSLQRKAIKGRNVSSSSYNRLPNQQRQRRTAPWPVIAAHSER